MKGGLGSASITLPDGLVVAALVAVNAVGDVIDPATGRWSPACGRRMARAWPTCESCSASGALIRRAQPRAGENTTIGVVATNAKLTKVQAQKIAQMAHDGYARAISPVHTPGTATRSSRSRPAPGPASPNLSMIGALAAEAMADAIVRAVTQNQSLGGSPSARELNTVPARFK